MPALCEALTEEGVDSRLLAFALDRDSPLTGRTRIIAERAPWPLYTVLGEEVARWRAEAAREGRNFVCHSHGLWSLLNHALAVAARADGAPLAISLHGMLLPWARRHKAVRKSIAWRLYQARDLALAGAVHVTSEDERAAAETAGVTTPLSVIPFGVALPPVDLRYRDGARREQERTLLFLGRVHPVKNLAALIDAFADVRPEGWRLLIVGPDEVEHRGELERLAASRRVAERVSFEAPVFGDAKRHLFARADLLALPSHSENYGAVVAEALAHGIPALASTGTPWRALENERCGWWVKPDRESLAGALRSILRSDETSLREMGGRGRAYVEQNLSWRTCAQRMAALYRRLATLDGDGRARNAGTDPDRRLPAHGAPGPQTARGTA